MIPGDCDGPAAAEVVVCDGGAVVEVGGAAVLGVVVSSGASPLARPVMPEADG